MKVTHFEISSADHSLLQSSNWNSAFIDAPLTQENLALAEDSEIVSVFVNSLIDQAVIDALPKLRLIASRSTGFDHIDVKYAQSKGIMVCNVPAYGSRTVAEFAFALMLGLSRKVYYAIKQVKEQNDWSMNQFEGFNLQGKSLGVVGTGRIGLNVIQIAKGFGMNILANDAHPNEQAAKEQGFKYVSLNELLDQADIVTLHVPAIPETHHLINKDNISGFKKGALLINTSRGEVVDSEAILIGLENGYLSGAGLDVIEGEHELKEEAEFMKNNQPNIEKIKTLLEDHRLIQHPQVLITPHIAFNTIEARAEILAVTMDNINSFTAGQLQNQVA